MEKDLLSRTISAQKLVWTNFVPANYSISARETWENFPLLVSMCSHDFARKTLQRFALGVVIREQKNVTFEVTDASFRVSTCQA
jgi:hypothetical protein